MRSLRKTEDRLRRLEQREPQVAWGDQLMLMQALVPLYLDQACAQRMGADLDPLPAWFATWPDAQAAVEARLPVLEAWVPWHNEEQERLDAKGLHVYRLRGAGIGNWDWCMSAVRQRNGADTAAGHKLLEEGRWRT